ncbi:DUF3455 domain-containing protein [Tunturiibacter lichenicola]|jgi:Protein of unknown function (DUF3455)|uniref:DUF3455 domain-containing protein n=1 Tax=Tunturiibacter lichenicola TaxID=2051959 RepID=UPI003D9AF11A
MRSFVAILTLSTLSFCFASIAIAQTQSEPPSTQHPILTVTGKGIQIYICQQGPSGPEWLFQAPEANLTDASGNPAGTHSAGPAWNSKDGSSVKGVVLVKAASSDPNSIPWLLLRASGASGTGIMTKVEFIRRSDTHGGVAPATGCDAQHINTSARVPYRATYTFYSAKP